jgi:hypothetical protein
VLFSGNKVRNEYYLADFINHANDVIIPSYTNEQCLEIVQNVVTSTYSNLSLVSGEFFNEWIDYHSVTQVSIAYELVNPADAAYLDLLGQRSMLVETEKNVEILLTFTKNEEVIGTKTLVVNLKPRLVQTIDQVLKAPDNRIVSVEGTVEAVVDNEYWVLTDGTSTVLVSVSDYLSSSYHESVNQGDVIRILGYRQTLNRNGLVPLVGSIIDIEVISTQTITFTPTLMSFEEMKNLDYTNVASFMQEVIYTGRVTSTTTNFELRIDSASPNYGLKMLGLDSFIFGQEMGNLTGSMISASGYVIGVENVGGYFNWVMIVVDYEVIVEVQ